jgi:hypothetical protein
MRNLLRSFASQKLYKEEVRKNLWKSGIRAKAGEFSRKFSARHFSDVQGIGQEAGLAQTCLDLEALSLRPKQLVKFGCLGLEDG